ncbi:HIT family protein [Spongisporangium articulatum]|uniref:HIT family protein n=1 Tax=Spongisporangium articulatum TaxID=3362603 RepID=A0ABW8AHR0_9ACTN
MSLYFVGNARHAEQAERMRALEAAGVCLFCPEQLDAEPAAGLVASTDEWTVRRNDFPYAGTKLHLLVVPRRHVTDLVDLPDAVLAQFWPLVRSLREEFDLTYYGLGARCGDPACTGGTIAHVHVHLLVGDVDDPGHEPVRLKLSSRRSN